MATLPDLDPTSISHIAFYNVKEQNGLDDSQWDPSDFTSIGGLQSFDIYDNGIDGIIDIGSVIQGGRYTTNIRVKNDGWVIMYDNTDTDYYGITVFSDGTDAEITGDYNFFGVGLDEVDFNEPNDGVFSAFTTAISDAGYTAPSPAPGETLVGYYSYDHESAANISLINSGSSIEFTYTDTVNLLELSGFFKQENGGIQIGGQSAITVDNQKNLNEDDMAWGMTAELVNEEATGATFDISTVSNTSHQFLERPVKFDDNQGPTNALAIWS